MLFKKIKLDSLTARKNKDKDKSNIYSFLISEIKTIEKNNSNMPNFNIDNIAMDVLKKSIKSVKENIAARPNDIKYQNELDLYMSYMPEQISEDKLRKIIIGWKKDNYPDTPNIGGAMKALKRCYDGQYDPKMASSIVREVYSEDN